MTATTATTVLRTIRRDAATETTTRKRAELVELARRFQRARRRHLAEYSDPVYVLAILRGDRRLVEARRRAGWLSDELSPHQNKVCLETALGTLRSQWQAALKRAATDVLRDPSWIADRPWALETIRSPRVLAARLFAPSSSRKRDARARRLRKLVLIRRGRSPRTTSQLWFELDSNLYRAFSRSEDRHFRGAWIAITGIHRGRRINVPLAGRSIDDFRSRTGRSESRPNIRVVINRRITIYVAERIQPARREGTNEVGIDKGLSTLAVVSRGSAAATTAYGGGLNDLIGEIVDSSDERRRHRQRITAYERSLRNTDGRAARRIRRRNLGAKKFQRRNERDRARLRQFVNRTLNTMFCGLPEVGRVHCEDLSFWRFRPFRRLNRRLGRWLKGYLNERLHYKAELNGVELNVVNAAYTSQSCPACWFTSAVNRSGDRFVCANCGYAGSADAIAATNILRRGSDSAITRFTSLAEVKHTLDGRWRSARIGRAWDSNEVALAADNGEAIVMDRVANDSLPAGQAGVIHTAALYSSPSTRPRPRPDSVV